MAAEREVRYNVKVNTNNAEDAVKRLQTQVQLDAQKIARSEALTAQAKTKAASEVQKASQQELRAAAEKQRISQNTARVDSQAAAAKTKAQAEVVRLAREEERLVQQRIRTEQTAAQAKIAAEREALRLKQQQAQTAAADARLANAGRIAGNVTAGLGFLKGGLAAVGITLGVQQIAQQTAAVAQLNVQVTRSKQAFTALSGGAQEAERRLNAIQQASANTMTSVDAMNLANRMTALGMAKSAKEMETAVSAARKIAVVMGTDTVGAIENLALAASNVSFLRLDQMGISASAVRDRMAELRAENSSLGREQAFLQAALQISAETLKDVDISGRDAASGVEALNASWGRLKETVATGGIGQAANRALLFLSDGLDRGWGEGATRFSSQQRQFGERLDTARNGGFAAWGNDLAVGERIATTVERISKAIADGVPVQAEYLNSISDIMSAWVEQGGAGEASIDTLNEIDAVLGRLSDTSTGYARLQAKVSEASLDSSKSAQALVEAQTRLEVAYAAGQMTASEYTSRTNALSSAFETLKGDLTEVATLTDDVRDAMREAAAAQDLFARSGGALGSASGPLSQAQSLLYGNAYNFRNQGGIIDPATGAPQVDPKSGARVLQSGAWGFVPGLNDGSEQWQWESEQRKQAEEDRQRIAREEEQAAKEWQRVAERTEKELTAAAEKMAREFENKLSQIDGLFGTSAVTEDDMMAAKEGYYQEKPDEWLRQLADEVLNKVDHPGTDIGDAKRRAGIDGGVPDKVALQMIQGMWADSSLFAGGRNLDLINQGAVRANLARQDASQSGRDAILAMFGGSVAPGASGSTAGGGSGEGGTDEASQIVGRIQSQIDSEEVAKQLGGIGANLARGIHSGFSTEVDSLDWRSPIVNSIAAEVTTLVANSLADNIKP